MSDYEDFETNHPSVDLSGFDDDFATAEAPEYDEVPDGKYQARIESVRLENSQKQSQSFVQSYRIIASNGRLLFIASTLSKLHSFAMGRE
jgi:hypothetical protein